MATNIRIPEDLYSQLQAKAEAEGKTVDELAAATLQESLREKKSWEQLLARGEEYGRTSGIREEDVVNVIHEWRNEQRGR